MHATFQKKAKFNIYSVLLLFFFVIVLAQLKIESSAFLSSHLYRNLCSCLMNFLYSKIRFKFLNTKINFKFTV